MQVTYILLQALLLTTALSADAFASGFAYGANKIKMPFLSVLVISLVCTGALTLSLSLGNIIGSFIPEKVTVAICAGILIILGLVKIFGGLIKSKIKKSDNTFLKLCAEPEKADLDDSKSLSIKEAFLLAVALSLDGLAVGVGAGLVVDSVLSYIAIISFSLLTDIIFLASGALLGRKIARKLKVNLSWLSGLVLIGLALVKIFL